jgi:hypothetical protein
MCSTRPEWYKLTTAESLKTIEWNKCSPNSALFTFAAHRSIHSRHMWNAWDIFCKTFLLIQKNLHIPCRQQFTYGISQGKVERRNRTVQEKLSAWMITNHTSEWWRGVFKVQHAINSSWSRLVMRQKWFFFRSRSSRLRKEAHLYLCILFPPLVATYSTRTNQSRVWRAPTQLDGCYEWCRNTCNARWS